MASEMEETADNLDEERRQIMKLQSEMARKKEQIARLQAKKEALGEEFTDRSSALKDLKARIKDEEAKMIEKRPAGTNDEKDEAIAKFIKDDVLTLLRERIPFMADLEEDDEQDEAQGPQESKVPQQEVNPNTHQSVLVRYHVWTPLNIDNKDNEFYVTYRIDKETTIKGLHLDACKYWGCSPMEYCMVTGFPPYEELPLDKNPGLAVQHSSVLPSSEMAMLHLVKRQDLPNWLNKMRGDEKKLGDKKAGEAAVPGGATPKEDQTGKGAGKTADANSKAEPWLKAFKEWPGLYNLLSERTVKTKGQRVGVTCGDVVITILTLIFLTSAGFLRSAQEDFALVNAVHMTTIEGIRAETTTGEIATNFNDISTQDELFEWLLGSFHYQVFSPNSTLRRFYEPVGSLRIHQKKARRTEECRRPELDAGLGLQMVCYYVELDPDTIEKSNININGSVFARAVDAGRLSSIVGIVSFQEAPDYYLPFEGKVQDHYVGGGYEIHYSLHPDNITASAAAMLQEATFLRDSWLSIATRFIAVEVVFANYHRGAYVEAVYMFELPPSGVVVASSELRPFRIDDSNTVKDALILEWLAFAIQVLWIIGPRCRFEITKKNASKRPGYLYLFSFGGFLDMQAVALPVVITTMQLKSVGPKPFELAPTQWFSYGRTAFNQKQIGFARALMFFIVMLRLTTFGKLLPQVAQFSKVMGRSVYHFIWYMFIVAPLLLGIVFLGSCVYAGQLFYWSTWWEALTSTLLLVRMDLDVIEMESVVPIITVIFVTYFVFFMTVFFLFGFMAIGVHAYFEVKLTDSPGDYRWSYDQWLDWMLWGRVYTLITKKEPGSSLREETRDLQEDDDDSGSDSDDDVEPGAAAAAKDK
mmetsp:Transcript_23460/g.54706  ORF Transcript_23460/g.54706 Transcript_23460/m.54706 type:complete len:869 (-) Transcript_23460:90-2696(-)|eukprot:CAMPEP_0178392058 /NCGR_PEP_ID=MMETSP0689_2-20121128/11484_1 /TAXON_ID=160604 /ORGANISM="Amphidinium massartii, Strain CS-259" /LENGTH=868 /DNA_ID=CAMNT_0020012623 /DNA_START=43 /DNA_END=2649 /DNA_ORIENTATION=+